MGKRTFNKTVIEVVVLSEGPYDPESLEDVAYDIVNGDCSGGWTITETEELNEAQVAEELKKQDSDPSFLLGPDWEEDED